MAHEILQHLLFLRTFLPRDFVTLWNQLIICLFSRSELSSELSQFISNSSELFCTIAVKPSFFFWNGGVGSLHFLGSSFRAGSLSLKLAAMRTITGQFHIFWGTGEGRWWCLKIRLRSTHWNMPFSHDTLFHCLLAPWHLLKQSFHSGGWMGLSVSELYTFCTY